MKLGSMRGCIALAGGLVLAAVSTNGFFSVASGAEKKSAEEEKPFVSPYHFELHLKYDNTQVLVEFKSKDGKHYQSQIDNQCRIKFTQGGGEAVPFTVAKQDGVLVYDFHDSPQRSVLLSITQANGKPFAVDDDPIDNLPLALDGKQDLRLAAELNPLRDALFVDVWGGKSPARGDLQRRWLLSGGRQGTHVIRFRKSHLPGPDTLKGDSFVSYEILGGPEIGEKGKESYLKIKDHRGKKQLIPLEGVGELVLSGEGGPPSHPEIPFRILLKQVLDKKNKWSRLFIQPANVNLDLVGGRRYREKHKLKELRLVRFQRDKNGGIVKKEDVYPLSPEAAVILVSSDDAKLGVHPSGKEGELIKPWPDEDMKYSLADQRLIIQVTGKELEDSQGAAMEAEQGNSGRQKKASRWGCSLIHAP